MSDREYWSSYGIERLNPYSNGIYSMRIGKAVPLAHKKRGLNPYSNGIYSMSLAMSGLMLNTHTVLILILMEYTL